MRIPVATAGIATFVMIIEKPKDRETGEPIRDRDTGAELWDVHCTAVVPGEAKPQVWSVRMPTEPKGINVGQPAELVGLEAITWEFNGRHGVRFRATGVRPVASKAAA